MKKKFLFAFLAIMFVLPVMLLSACGEPTKYTFTFKTSSQELGGVSCVSQTSEGTTTVAEGQQITLVATAFENKNSYFAGWVYQNLSLITESSEYEIVNIKNEQDQVIKSELKFSSSSEKQGQYTAVFAGGNTEFVKLNSFYLTTDIKSAPKTDATVGAQALTNATIEISQETGSNNPKLVYSTTADGSDIPLFNSTLITPENINSVLHLEYDNPMYVSVNMHFALNGEIQIYDNIIANLTYGKSTEKTTDTQKKVSSEVVFDGTTYQIIFSFSVAEQEYFMVLNYSPLA